MKVISYGKSIKGRDHEENEDSFLIDMTKNLFAVADGVTIPFGGKIASEKAITYLKKYFNGNLLESILNCNKKICEEKKKNKRIGYTTISAIHIKNKFFELVNLGDSPIFLIREEKIKKLSESHSFESRLTQVIGMENISPYASSLEVEKNDILILCTDGITNVLSENEILSLKAKNPKVFVEKVLEKCEEKHQVYDDDKTIIVIFLG